MADPEPPPILPSHIQETVGTLARLHAAHHQDATRFQRAVGRTTGVLTRPVFIGLLTLFIAAWISVNLLLPRYGMRAPDPPPFSFLCSAVSLASLYLVVLILAAQRRDDQLAQYREQLTLELAILSEQKTTKVIRLIEEARRDSPILHDRIDHEAEAMAEPSDPQSVLDEIKKTHAEAATRMDPGRTR